MKTMTCNQLGGACDVAFHANTFEEMAEQSKQHAVKMFERNDAGHLAAAVAMKNLMREPGAMQEWFEAKRAEFDALPDDNA